MLKKSIQEVSLLCIKFDSNGDYSLRTTIKIFLTGLAALIIFGCGGDSGSDNTEGNKSVGNHPPTVSAGNDRDVTVGSTVTLDGSDCSDSDNDPLTYDWHFISQPQDSSSTLSDNTTISPSFYTDEAGEYIIELAVSDGIVTVTDSVIITASVGQTISDCSQIVPGDNMADDFVCAHNEVRQNAQPTPSPQLPDMTWDPELARIAQNYAETCTWEHNSHCSDTYPGYVGENLYMTTWPNSTPEDAVQSWADEAQYYDHTTNTCQNGQVCGHYTQVVWRDSTKIGCAKVFCSSVANSNFTNADLYVCNYAPGGNIIGEKPY